MGKFCQTDTETGIYKGGCIDNYNRKMFSSAVMVQQLCWIYLAKVKGSMKRQLFKVTNQKWKLYHFKNVVADGEMSIFECWHK